MSTAMASPIRGKNVFAHFMMGNTYPYRPANFRTDIEDAIEAGIDGFALNLGQDSWAPARVETMFSVASEFPQYKLFFSFDMSIITSASVIVDYVLRYVKHRNSFWYDNRYFMSTFAGESQSFGHGDVNEGWDVEVRQKLKDKGVEICFVPSWTGMDAWKMFERFPVVDGAFSWAAWYVSYIALLTQALSRRRHSCQVRRSLHAYCKDIQQIVYGRSFTVLFHPLSLEELGLSRFDITHKAISRTCSVRARTY